MSKGFLKVAEDILKNIDNYSGSQKEFYIRTGISRAYYGLIWQLKERLEKQGYNFKGKNIHHFIPKVLADIGKFKEAKKFEELKTIRNDADYRYKSEFKKLKTIDKRTLKTYIKNIHLLISRIG
ncbi:MAG: Spc97/Spc98 family protein [Aquificae bacterium]|nr:Spc97/Spc98 family protein [Aquificota bacterium]